MPGMAVGWGIEEGWDKAALLSLVVAAYVIFQAWVTSEKAPFKRLFWGGLRLALVAGFAAFLAAQVITSLVGTQHGCLAIVRCQILKSLRLRPRLRRSILLKIGTADERH